MPQPSSPLLPFTLRCLRVSAAACFSLVLGATPCAHAQGAITPSTQTPANQQPAGNTPPAGQTLPNAAKLPSYDESQPMTGGSPPGTANSGTDNLQAWQGLLVSGVEYRGVPPERLQPLQKILPLQPGQPLDSAKIRATLRRLYATGVYSNIDVAGVRSGDDVLIIFDGEPQLFIGRVNVDGINDETIASLLQGAAKLSPGTPYTDGKLTRGKQLIENLLVTSGYYQGKVEAGHSIDRVNQQMDVNYIVSLGPRAKVGAVKVNGTTGLTPEKFRKLSKLKANSAVTRDTLNTALDKLRAHYQKEQLLASKVKLDDKHYQQPTNHLDYTFSVEQGSKVQVVVNGVKVSQGSVRNLVPIYEEGTVDEDLLNEGNRRIRDLYQRKGYFDIQVTHEVGKQPNGATLVTYTVQLGNLHRVDAVTITGNQYFSSDLITPRLNVQPASLFDHRGTYSAALVASDVATITAIYEGSGFSHVAVKPVVKDADVDKKGAPSKIAHITVQYQITEGVQQRFGQYKLVGNVKEPDAVLHPLLNAQVGQPYNSLSLTGDRDAVLTYYLSHGYDQAHVELKQVADPRDPNLIDITLEVTEGDQVHVNNVIVSGLHYTRAATVDPHILVHSGDLLNQTALIDTQRQLYDLTLFNGVNTAVQNASGDELKKNVLLQFTEAKRWDVTYGFGFQVQTGTPYTTSVYENIINGVPTYTNPNGKLGASALVTVNISRINLRGSDNSLSLKTTYGSLEKIALLTFADPHPFGKRSFTFSVDGGYTNEQDVTTYAASKLLANMRLSERATRATTWIYQYQFRRVSVAAGSLQIAADEIPLQSEPVTVGGPGVTWIRDTRRPTPLDASGGTYNTVQEFFSDGKFGSQSNFNRLDGTNATYYPFGNVHRYVFARQTRIAYERSFGVGYQRLIPLPERLYAGGAESHRGFGINDAGPRDSLTGFPIGGAAAFVNSFELRLPPPKLPYVGNSVSFVLFHDMGNVFVKGSDIWPSFLRFRQPDRDGCRDLDQIYQQETPDEPYGVEKNSIGLAGHCSDNYFSHALGLGARYGTPIGPIRVDASYNLNPPLYPVLQDNTYDSSTNTLVSQPPHYSQAGHFNFFFSIGQAF